MKKNLKKALLVHCLHAPRDSSAIVSCQSHCTLDVLASLSAFVPVVFCPLHFHLKFRNLCIACFRSSGKARRKLRQRRWTSPTRPSAMPCAIHQQVIRRCLTKTFRRWCARQMALNLRSLPSARLPIISKKKRKQEGGHWDPTRHPETKTRSFCRPSTRFVLQGMA